MQDTKKLSIKELNEVLGKLQHNETIPQFGTFSEMDIVFVAGIFLWFKQHEKNWKKIPLFFNLSEDNNIWKFSLYFKMIAELYGIKHYQIFDGIPIVYKKNENSYSNFFAPPIYITEENIEYFFGEKESEKINHVKNNYIARFDITDFLIKSKKNYKNSKKRFTEYEDEIKNTLKNCSPIFTYIFIIASKNLAEKIDESYENRKDYIDKLWLFAQDYVRGLYELAKNIVEHSGNTVQKGEGMITIRAYQKNKLDNSRILETHVFDYGEKGIIPKLIEYTNEKATKEIVINERIKKCYIEDRDFFVENKNYELKDFISPKRRKELKQQTFRHTSHYGINKFHKLIQIPLNGEMYVTSEGISKRNYFGDDAEQLTLRNGTHYYFKIPFVPNNFKNIEAKPFSKENQTAVLGETASIEFLSKIEIANISLNQLSKISTKIQNSLINITIEEDRLTKSNIESIYHSLDKLLELKDNNRIAINLQNKFSDVSVLLRFLSYLTFEYKQPFIIYNIDFRIYNDLLADNRDFKESRKGEAYWHGEQAMLLFVKTHNDFYFADILFGNKRDEFLLVNSIISKTFPNTITLLQEIDDKKRGAQTDYLKSISSNQNLRQFFYPESNNLLPFDTLLKNGNNDTSIFISNLTCILQNSLFNRADKYDSLDQYIKNIDGFRIQETHFKIGTKIHSEDFYYAKRLFQNSFYTARLAMLLSIKILEKITDTEKEIMLVGYEMYSELLLSLVEKFIKDFSSDRGNNKVQINHFITQSDENKYKFLPNDTFKKYLNNYNDYLTIIIVPIAATGNTANKIENDIREQIYHQEKRKNQKKNKPEEIARKIANDYKFFDTLFNIILAQPEIGFETIKKSSKNQTTIIKLPAKWYNIKDCPLCCGIDENQNKIETKALFETDKSSLTPALIFGKPIGKVKSNVGNEIESNCNFIDLHFEESLRYKMVYRNNTYRIYYIESEKFIQKNLSKIQDWLENTVSLQLRLKPTDKIVIVSPCHETNSRFLNLVNQFVFNSSATIIHHQSNIDFAENFKLLNRAYFTSETKVFYVDDSLITGKHYYEIYDLVRDIFSDITKDNLDEQNPFVASIILKDKSESFTHNKIVEMSNIFFTFANLNQPPALNSLEQRPLEHERQRYESLSKTALHDVSIGFFQKKASELNPQKLINSKVEKKDGEKERRRLKSFEATHKIYDFFANNRYLDEYKIDEIVNFKPDKNSPSLFPELPNPDNLKSLLKVLSQYPFILYQPIREKTFNWLKNWLNEIEKPNEKRFEYPKDYSNFQTIKFLLRRATLLGNYQVLEKEFLHKIISWFIKIDKHIDYNKLIYKQKNDIYLWQENLRDFPIYVLRNYMELIQKNGWAAYRILKNIKDSKLDLGFQESKQGMQFLRMLQIESALVIEDFYEMIIRERRFEWRDIFKDYNTFIEDTEEIVEFFQQDSNIYLLDTNKYLVVKETFLNNSNEWIKPQTQFINYLWIKQLLFVDCIDKNPYFPKNIDYQKKINVILEKMKGFFSEKNKIKVFFVVTDGQQNPHVLREEQNLLNNFSEEFEIDKKNRSLVEKKENIKHKTQILINFLNGIESNTGIASETTAEFYRNQSEEETQRSIIGINSNMNVNNDGFDLFSERFKDFWTDAYNQEIAELTFMPKESKWLYLVRITKHNVDINNFDTLGLLGFYSTENLYNTTESLLPKQLLMLLRRDMGKFIEKHHKNDEFAGLIQQKEKADYQFMLKHGINEYKEPLKKYFDKTYDLIPNKNEDIKKLKRYFDFEVIHLTNKIDLMQKFSKFDCQNPDYFETFSLKKIIETFIADYEYIFKFERTGLYFLAEKDNISDYIQLFDLSVDKIDLLDTEIDFPETILEEMIFELVYNIRKHVLNLYSKYIKNDKLNIYLDFTIEDDIIYFKISNNYCEKNVSYFNRIYNNNKLDGLNLINSILKKANIGKIKVTIKDAYDLKDKIIDIYIPLKQLSKNEKYNNN